MFAFMKTISRMFDVLIWLRSNSFVVVKYPPTLVTTGDHDDRVVPAHSFKFAARLQETQAGTAPVLIRIETKAGHGAGKPTGKAIEEVADLWAFLVKTLDFKPVIPE